KEGPDGNRLLISQGTLYEDSHPVDTQATSLPGSFGKARNINPPRRWHLTFLFHIKTKRKMKYLISVACISAIACMFLQCAETSSQTMEGETTVRATLQDTIDRGHHLVEAVGCHDCHTPKRMGEMGPELVQDLLLSGYPGDRPFEKPHLEATK